MSKATLIIVGISLFVILFWATESYELGTLHYRGMLVGSVSMNPERDFYTVSGSGFDCPSDLYCPQNIQLDKLWAWQYNVDLERLALEVNQTISDFTQADRHYPIVFSCYGFSQDDNRYPMNYSDCFNFCVLKQLEPHVICDRTTITPLAASQASL